MTIRKLVREAEAFLLGVAHSREGQGIGEAALLGGVHLPDQDLFRLMFKHLSTFATVSVGVLSTSPTRTPPTPDDATPQSVASVSDIHRD